jgi:DNA invertase Pin-like site-specific DNA recombinase
MNYERQQPKRFQATRARRSSHSRSFITNPPLRFDPSTPAPVIALPGGPTCSHRAIRRTLPRKPFIPFEESYGAGSNLRAISPDLWHNNLTNVGFRLEKQLMIKFIAYFRVSTARQGRSGLGLDAQREMVTTYAASQGATIIEEHTEIESGRNTARPVLESAIKACKATGATLLVAKLDRLSRDSHEIGGLIKRVPFKCAQFPDADVFMLQIYAAMAEQEAKNISARTKAALAVAKARGTRLGNPALKPGSAESAQAAREAWSQKARAKAEEIAPYVVQARWAGAATLAQVAQALTARGIRTPSGRGGWHPAQVARVMNYVEGSVTCGS